MSSFGSDSKKNNARYCLIQSASKLFARLGLDKCSTRDIAEESKVNISMISYHFGGKEGLYKQVITDFARKMEKNASEILMPFASRELTKESFTQEVSAIIDHMIKTRIENPEIGTLLAREKIEGLPLSRDIHEQIIYPLVQKFLKLFERAQEKNIIRADINAAVFFLFMTEGLWGFYEMSQCKTKLFGHCESMHEKPTILRDQVLKIYLEGILL